MILTLQRSFAKKGTSGEIKNQKKLKLDFEVWNLIVAPDEYLKVSLEVDNF